MPLSVSQCSAVAELERLVRVSVRAPHTLGGRAIHKCTALFDLLQRCCSHPVGSEVIGNRMDVVPLDSKRALFSKSAAAFDPCPFFASF